MRITVRRLAIATACSLATLAIAAETTGSATATATAAASAGKAPAAGNDTAPMPRVVDPTQNFYRMPAVRGDRVVFVAEGDLWQVAAAGGTAQRLTTHGGAETFPAVSPDGRWIAFVGQQETTGDVFVMPAAGGVPRRLTWDTAGVRVWGITADNEVLYSGATERGEPGTQLHLVNLVTGKHRALPVGQASDGALSPDGKTLYFTRNGLRGDNARQYRGGALARLWVMDLAGTAEAKPLFAEGANDRRPMPYTDASGTARVAFLSDRDGTFNLWSVKADGSDPRQHTRHKGWDVRHASLDGTQAVYALGADLYRVSLDGTAAEQKLAITLGGDYDQQRKRWVGRPQDFLSGVSLSPNGEQVVLTARGRLATQGVGPLRRAELPVPAAAGDAGRCRDAAFSGDSREVFALCDYSGEVELWRFAANGAGQPKQVTEGATAMRRSLAPSPDGRWIAHTDKEGRLFLTDLKHPARATATREVDRDQLGDGAAALTWSPDGKALAFVRATDNPYREQLMLLTVADGKVHQLGSDRYAATAPAFSPDGQWLYFLSRRTFNVTGNPGPWGDRNMGPFFDKGWKIYALALQPGLRFPFAAPDELQGLKAKEEAEVREQEKDKPDNKESKQKVEEAKADAAKEAKPAAKGGKPEIQIPGLALRLYEVPAAAGNYGALAVDSKRLYVQEGNTLRQLPIGPQETKLETFADGVAGWDLSADGKKLLIRRTASGGAAPEILIVDAGPRLPGELDKSRVRWSDWQIAVDPRAEWRQMFNDAWRMQRDFFYDKDMHGVDWAAMRAKYAPLVDRVTERGELAEVMAQMVGELSLLHSQVAPGELRKGVEEPGYAGLGARLEPVANGWKIARVFAGDPELPSEAGPLAAPGLNIAVGTVITQVNGRPATAVPDLSELMRGQAGKQVLLQLREASGKERAVVVTPVDVRREGQLRVNDWRYGRARAVDTAGGGKIGYLHLRAMTRDDIGDFVREFYAQSEREGLIIDVRHNNGGNIDSWILQTLLRRAWAFWQPRSPYASKPYPNMQQVFRGKVVVLANEETYSDGETFSEGFKRLGLGPVIGTTTSGAGVWLSDQNRLMDNGLMRAAENGQITVDGQFLVEGKGVTPDITVDNLPRATANGQDAQLDAAIAWLKDAIAKDPIKTPKPGPYLRPIKQ
ncbi:S41 family peptidase [Mitsuaria sp. GD03876]|uniref:S41 family peptidase n=1 Tax=Mitsuaria sp. GD03876 TaxID=2975399 RepID=UPI002447D851|nr:S41 family peptidase [Mitsuaria sp. GD03876]MDH0864170.1 S41 family peptidase [Mitsuaria sp. GD03876]